MSSASVVYTSSVFGKSAKYTLSVFLAIVLGIFVVSPVRMVYTFDNVLRSTLSMSSVVVLNSPGVSGKSIHKYM